MRCRIKSAAKTHIAFGRPQHGWLPLTLRIDQQQFAIVASAVPNDSITDLAGAIALLLKGGPEVTVFWNEEPVEYRFCFLVDEEDASFALISVRGRSDTMRTDIELLRARGSKVEVCLPFWRALRRLESSMAPDEYKAAWGYRFPSTKVREITSLVKQARER